MSGQLSLPGSAATLVSGRVVRVRFCNPENGYSVLIVDVGGGRQETWVGSCAAVSEGQTVNTHGILQRDARWGEQRKCDSILPSMPTDAKGIETYLASGAVPGIGPALARAIVARFGDKTLSVFDDRPDDLLRVPGYGPAKLKLLKETWPLLALDAQVMCKLAALGAPAGLATKIVKRFKAEAMAVITHAPYRLALEVSGVGFKTADQIARAVGIPVDAPERAQAGVMHVLSEVTSRGDCYLPVDKLADLTATMLGECANTYDAIADLSTTKVRSRDDEEPAPRIVVEDGDYGPIVYPRDLYEAETRFAARIREMLDVGDAPLPGAHEAIAAFEAKSRVSLAPAQRAAVEAAAKHRVVVITGSPGTGKSTIAKAVLSVFNKAGVKFLLASPTGRAAKRLSETTDHPAATIHRMLGIPKNGGGRMFLHNRKNPLPTSALLVDEVSMCDIALANATVQALPPTARLVLIGDVDQLPSVGPGAVLRDMIASEVIPTVRLTHIFRQASGSAILDAVQSVNAGRVPTGKSLNPHDMTAGEFFIEVDDDDSEGRAERAARHVVRLACITIPHRFGFHSVDDLQVITPMLKGPTGTIELNRRLQEALNPEGPALKRGDAVFRVGDKVIQCKNDNERDIFNGDMGRICRLDVEADRLVVMFDEREVVYERADLEHLRLAYAITCHRFQGSEQKACVVVMRSEHYMMLSRNWAYTALSRGKRLVVLVTDERAIRTAVRETRREVRRTGLAQRLRGDA